MSEQKFYQTNWFIWLSLIFLSPLGIFLMWKYKKFGPRSMKLLTVVFSLWFIIIGVKTLNDPEEQKGLASANKYVKENNIQSDIDISNNDKITENESRDNNESSISNKDSNLDNGKEINNIGSIEGEIEIHFLDVGQADCILILEPTGHNMLIDAGNNEDSDLITKYIKESGVSKLDIVVGTHPHEDHIGSLDTVINNFDVEKVYMPKVIHDTKTYEDVLLSVKNKGLKITTPHVGDQFTLGNAQVTIVAPNSSEYEELNNYSIVLKLKYGDKTFLFTGDAEGISETEMLNNNIDLSADVLKVGHHGSDSSTTTPFLEKVKPKYAVISSGVDNKYGHPSNETLDKLQAKKIEVYRTDEVGTIVIKSDGKSIKVDKKSSEIKENAPPQQVEKEQEVEEHNKKETEVIAKKDIEITSVTNPISKGCYADVSIKGVAGEVYDITVYYSSGASKAKGLDPKTADSNGNISWSWKVGTRTKPGSYKIEINGNQQSVSTYFEVR